MTVRAKVYKDKGLTIWPWRTVLIDDSRPLSRWLWFFEDEIYAGRSASHAEAIYIAECALTTYARGDMDRVLG